MRLRAQHDVGRAVDVAGTQAQQIRRRLAAHVAHAALVVGERVLAADARCATGSRTSSGSRTEGRPHVVDRADRTAGPAHAETIDQQLADRIGQMHRGGGISPRRPGEIWVRLAGANRRHPADGIRSRRSSPGAPTTAAPDRAPTTAATRPAATRPLPATRCASAERRAASGAAASRPPARSRPPPRARPPARRPSRRPSRSSC